MTKRGMFHKRKRENNMVLGINTIDTIDTCWQHQSEVKPKEWTQRYIEGKYPPHYPLPSLMLEVAIEHNRVMLWDYTTPKFKYLTYKQ